MKKKTRKAKCKGIREDCMQGIDGSYDKGYKANRLSSYKSLVVEFGGGQVHEMNSVLEV